MRALVIGIRWIIREAEADRDALIRRCHAQAAAPAGFTGTLYRRTSPRP